MFASPLHKDPRLPELYDLYARKRAAQDRVRLLKKRIQATHDVLQMEELKSRKRVLRRLGFTSADDIVDVKGRVACEISTGDELLLTELIFNGVFNPLAPEHCAGLLSCFVFTEKVRVPQNGTILALTLIQSEHQTKLKEELAAPLRVMQENARRIAKVCRESKLPIVEEEYVQSFKVELMDAVVQWCRGASFSDICKVSDTRSTCVTSPCSYQCIICSSQTSSRAASFAFSGGCKSSSDRWPRLPKSLATSSSNKSSKKHPRCSSGPIPSSLLHRCIFELVFAVTTFFSHPLV